VTHGAVGWIGHEAGSVGTVVVEGLNAAWESAGVQAVGGEGRRGRAGG